MSPISHAIALGLLLWIAVRLRRSGAGPGSTIAIAGSLAAWALLSSALAYRDQYRQLNEELLLIVVATLVPFALLGLWAALPATRAALIAFVLETPLASLHRVHMVRVLALGTIGKWWAGDLPGHFILPVGVPDFAIGASAWWMARRAARDPAGSRRALIAWNAAGAAALLLAPPLIQLTQPGPLHLFTQGPTTDEVLGFPMSIVPTFVAPLFVALHLATILRLYTRAP